MNFVCFPESCHNTVLHFHTCQTGERNPGDSGVLPALDSPVSGNGAGPIKIDERNSFCLWLPVGISLQEPTGCPFKGHGIGYS